MILLLGRTSRIAGSNAGELPEILQLAVQAGFDWVVYDDVNYARVSVIPDGESRAGRYWQLLIRLMCFSVSDKFGSFVFT